MQPIHLHIHYNITMNIPVVWKNIKNHMENPDPPLLNQHFDPPPCFCLFVCFFFCFYKILLQVKIFWPWYT